MSALAVPAHDPASRPAALRIGVLHNPRSGTNLRARSSIPGVCAAQGGIPCADVVDPESIALALRDMAAREVNTIVISGGDGTVSAVLNVVLADSPFPRPPLLAVLQGGTTNMTALDVGLRGRQQRALGHLIARAAQGGEGLDVDARPVMRVDPGAGRPAVYGMFFGAAAISQGIQYCKRKVHAVGLRGEIGPGITMARFIVAMARGERAIVTPVPVTVAIDGASPASFDCQVMYVTTLRRLVLGLRPYWGTEPAPLHYTSVRAGPRHLLRALPAFLRGRPNRFTTPANGYVSHSAHRLEFRLDSPVFVDGEIVSPAPGIPLVLANGGVLSFLKLR